MRRRAATLLVLCACGVRGSAPIGNRAPPPGVDHSIRAIDWTNRQGDYVAIDPPAFGDLTGDGSDEAVIASRNFPDVLHHDTRVQIYTMRNGVPVLLATIPGGTIHTGNIDGASIEGDAVRVDREHAERWDGDCCPSTIWHQRYRWDGHEFVEDVAARTRSANQIVE